jgi:hypothetical protein
MTPDDIPAAARLSRASGWNQTEADWRFLVEGNPGRFVAAVHGGRLVGTGGAVCYSDVLAWICMILVEEAERRRGVGSSIVTAVLERVAEVETVGLDATPAGRFVYEQHGFAAVAALLRVGGPADEAARAAGRKQTRIVADRDLEAIFRLDRSVFGADRSHALRWSRTAAPTLAWCFVEGDELAGYCFGRPGDRAVHVGPVVARDAAVARTLIGSAATAMPQRELTLDVPVRAAWLSELASLGLREKRSFTRMYRGAAAAPGLPGLLHAVFGPELG